MSIQTLSLSEALKNNSVHRTKLEYVHVDEDNPSLVLQKIFGNLDGNPNSGILLYPEDIIEFVTKLFQMYPRKYKDFVTMNSTKIMDIFLERT
jgi:hypothetical protein